MSCCLMAQSNYLNQCWLTISKVHWYSPKFHERKLSHRSLKLAWKLMIYELFFTQWGRVTHICVSKLTIIGSDSGLVPARHKPNQGWNILNWTPGNKLVEIQTLEHVVCEMAAILSRPQCVYFPGANKLITYIWASKPNIYRMSSSLSIVH